jgi:DNA-binding MarR family transcriptional regulator
METKFDAVQRVPDLESHLGYWLRHVSNAASGAFARSLKEKQTSVAEWVLMHELYQRGESAPGELADSLGLSRGAVSKIGDKLEAKGWVQVNSKAGDSRYRLLSLTRAGCRSLPMLAHIANRNDEAYFDCLSAKERAVLRQILMKLSERNRIRGVPTE